MSNGASFSVNELFGEDSPIELSDLTNTEEEGVSDASQEFLPYIPPVYQFQATSTRIYPVCQFATEGCTCCPGETCRRVTASTHRVVFNNQITCSFPQVLRLRTHESWQLPDDAQHQEVLGILSQRRSRTADLWGYPKNFRGFQSAEVRFCCKNDRIWFNPRGNRLGISWLLLAQQEEDRRFHFVYFVEKCAEVLNSFRITNPVYLNPSGNHCYSRMVEYEFEVCTSFQTVPTFRVWPPELSQNYVDHDDVEIFTHLSDDYSRGFLRLL